MEDYSQSVRFILTCNYPNKIMPAIHSRCQHLRFSKIDVNEYTARLAEILITENIEFDLNVLDTYVKVFYPDLRKCIGEIQLNSHSGVLTLKTSDQAESDYKFAMVDLFKEGKINEARKLICSQILPDEIDDMYRWLYDNIDLFGDETQQESAILIIKQGLVDHASVIDPEINLAATLIRLSRL